MGLLDTIKHFTWLTRSSLRDRRKYHAFSDWLKAFFLDASATRLGRHFIGKHSFQVRFTKCPQPLTLRTLTTDMLVAREIFQGGEYEIIKSLNLQPHSVILDLGANIGLASVYFSEQCEHARIVAVEPDISNLSILESNCQELISSDRLAAVHAFVGASDGEATIDRSGGAWGFQKRDIVAPEMERIKCVSLPAILESYGLEKVDLLKCDIEGSEGELFKNCARWIRNVKHLIVECHAPYSATELYHDLRSAGYNFEVLEESTSTHTVSVMRRVDD